MNSADADSNDAAADRAATISWVRQSPIASAMLNPAFVAAILATAAGGFRREASRGMPWTLSFIVAPLVLHRGTRDALPSTTRTHLTTWTSRNPVVRAGFPLRAQSLVEPVRAGLRFGMAHDVLILDGDRLNGRVRRPRGFQPPEELDEILRRASFAGRWLARAGSTATVFAVFGVAP